MSSIKNDPPATVSNQPDTDTGLPGVHTWRGIYLLVAAALVLWIILLTLLPHLFA